jgi:hypothetical protein
MERVEISSLREIAGPRPSPSFRLIQRPWPKGQHEFAVPVCAFHQQQNHATGNEREWWREHKIDPLAVAACLWRESQTGLYV